MSFESYQAFGISPDLYALSEQALTSARPAFDAIRKNREVNQLRVLRAMQTAGLSETWLAGTTGYGYDDRGREQIEAIYANVFGAQAAMVRIQISSGTQAIAACLFGLLRPGDELLAISGAPYDTLFETIGSEDAKHDHGSLRDFGISYRQIELKPDGSPDLDAIRSGIGQNTKVILIQKSRGYSLRRSLYIEDIRAMVSTIRESGSQAVIMVDNCYGEFVETEEPCHAGADLCAGSLIKNPGGGLSPSGGYIAGRADLVDQVAFHLTAPGLGRHVGPSLGYNRLIAQGFYMAPHIVAESLMGAAYAASLLQLCGYQTQPDPLARRGDLIQSVFLEKPERLIAFCQAVQAASPIDGFVTPEPWDMPGYSHQVIMAAGTFVQGASIELSADGPMRPPYPAYMQGGLCFEQVRLACMMAVQKMGVNQS